MNRLRSGIMGLVGVFAAMLVCGCSPDKFIVRGESGASVLSVDTHGFIRITGPIATEVDPESEDLAEHAGRGEFLVRNGNGQNVARVDGRTGNLYLLGQLEHDPQLEASALPEFVITDAAGTAMALIDAYGNLKYRGRIGMVMTRTVSSTEYTPCGTLEVTVTLNYYDTAPVNTLGVREQFPEGWTYVEQVSGVSLDIEPDAGEAAVLEFAWIDPPEFPLTFTYRVHAPQSAEGQVAICGQAIYRTEDPEYRSNSVTTYLTEDEYPEGEVTCEGEGAGSNEAQDVSIWDLYYQLDWDNACFDESRNIGDVTTEIDSMHRPCRLHAADYNPDWHIDLNELLRVIQFFNIGRFSCSSGTEDGYRPGGSSGGCEPHDADYLYGPDWRIQFTELLRIIQFFNSYWGGFHRVAPYRVTEDGYALGFPMPPGLQLLGDDLLVLEVGEPYIEPGAQAGEWVYTNPNNPLWDLEFVPISPQYIEITGDTVDIETPGTYQVAYNVRDFQCLQAAEVTREVVVASVEILSADITHDSIVVDLKPHVTTVEGTLKLELLGPGGVHHTIREVTHTGGSYLETFGIANLPEAKFEQIQATWTFDGEGNSTPVGTKSCRFRNMGICTHTTYDIPWESDDSCLGDPEIVCLNPVTGDCPFDPAYLGWIFARQVHLNG